MIRLASGCMLLAVALTPARGLAETQDGDKGKNYAFLVGCSKYIKTEFSELPFTGNDVNGFREALLKTGFPDEHVVVLHDAAKDPARYLPQRANIIRELELLMAGMREQDTLVVALSGHGVQFKGDPVSYFVPVDGNENDKSTLIALNGKDGLYDRLAKCKAQRKVLIVNASRNDPVAAAGLAPGNMNLAAQDSKEVPEGLAVIFSCQAGQKSYYDPDRKISLFFDHVNRAWKGDYARGSELTLEKFFDQVTDKTRSDAKKTLGVAQTPSVQREYPGKWLIPTAGLAKADGSDQQLTSEFAEFTRLLLVSWNKAEAWLGQHAATRQAAWRQAAKGGSPEAMVLLGECLESGKGLHKNEAEAVKWYRMAAELGNAWGQADLGRLYRDGRGVTKDHAEAIKWLRLAAEKGNPVGQTDLGRMYEDGQGVPKDNEEAVKWYRKAADQGSADGQNNLGWMHENGLGVAKDYAEAGKWYRLAADQDNPWAQNRLGVMYGNGLGVSKDEAEAIGWYRKSAEQGNTDGQNNLGWMYENGRGTQLDHVEAVKWYRKSADKGNAWAQSRLGVMYDNGRGVEEDPDEALKWFRKAAQQGNTDALNNLGVMYRDGRGVQNDDVEAVKWYRKSAEKGNSAAQNNLGWMYLQGRGVAQDDVEAIQWFRKASERGSAAAQFNLGWMYETGRGVRADLTEAVRWYRQASQAGNQDATEALRRLGMQ